AWPHTGNGAHIASIVAPEPKLRSLGRGGEAFRPASFVLFSRYGVYEVATRPAKHCLDRIAQHRGHVGIRVDRAPLGVEDPDTLASLLHDVPKLTGRPKQATTLLFELARHRNLQSRLHFPHDESGQARERRSLLLRDDRPRARIHHAKCAEIEAVRAAQGRARIEADPRRTRDERIVAETLILSGVGNPQYFGAADDLRAEPTAWHFL